jgi:lipopolysaccharide export system permease protein
VRRILPIIDGYVLGQILKAFAAVLVILLMTLFAQSFVKLLGSVARGNLAADVVFPLVGLELLRVAGFLIPPSFFFAVLYVLGRMYRDSEMGALAACGVGTTRIYRAALASAIPAALLAAFLMMGVLPQARQWIDVVKKSRTDATELAALAEGQFNEYSRGDLVVYLERFSADRTRMQNVFVQQREGQDVSILRAEEGYQYADEATGDRFLVFRNGQRYHGTPGSADYSVVRFGEYGVRVRGGEPQSGGAPRRAALPTAALLGSSDIRDRAELQERLSFPLAVLAFTLVAIPLSRAPPREGFFGRLLLAMLIYFVFVNLSRAAKKWMENGATPDWLGTWWVPLLMLLLAAVLLYTSSLRFAYWRGRLWARVRR